MTAQRWTELEDMVADVVSGSIADLGDHAEVEIEVQGLDDFAAPVVAFRGSESINELFCFDVMMHCEIAQESLRATVLGQSVTIRLQLPSGGHRLIHGIASHVDIMGSRGGRGLVHVRVVPRAWMATQRRNSKVFQDKNVHEVVAAVLADHGVAHTFSLAKRYERREYCLQYEESDFEFVTRLLAEEGLFFFFEHPAGADELRERVLTNLPDAAVGAVSNLAQSELSIDSALSAASSLADPTTLLQMFEISGPSEVLVIADTPTAYGVITGAETLQVDQMQGGALDTGEQHLHDWHARSTIVPTRATMRDYDPKRAGLPAGSVIGTTSTGLAGAASDLASAGVNAASGAGDGLAEAAGSAVGGAAGDMVSNAVGGGIGAALGAAGIASNVAFAHGIQTATHAEMSSEAAIARTAIAAGTAVAQELIDNSLVNEVVGGIGGAAQGLLGGGEGCLEVYEHHGEYEKLEATFEHAVVRLEQLRAQHLEGAAASYCRRILPGRTFVLCGHEVAAFNNEYAVVAVHHEFGAPEGEPLYRNELRCVPSSVPCRPEPPEKKIQQVVESAVVVGPDWSEIDTNRDGCVKIQFRWDRHGKHNEHSSCWVRVMQPWSGTGYGFQFIPRIGMEVMVAFIGGDINRPVVTGCIPNLSTPPPIQLPRNKTQSGIRTRSTPNSEGFNELSFEDATDRERIYLHAQRDWDTDVLRDKTTRIRRDYFQSVDGFRNEKVGESATWTIGGHRAERVGGDASLAIGANRATSVAGSDLINAHSWRLQTAHGACIEASSFSAIAGSGGTPGPCSIRASGSVSISGGERTHISSDTELLLSAGGTTLRLSPEGIELVGRNIALNAEGAHNILGAGIVRLKADDVLRVDCDKGLIKSSGASLGLTSEAIIDGSKILLNSPSTASDEVEDDPIAPATVEHTDSEGQPVAHGRFRVRMSDGTERIGMLDAQGRAELLLEQDAEVFFLDGDEPEEDDANSGAAAGEAPAGGAPEGSEPEGSA